MLFASGSIWASESGGTETMAADGRSRVTASSATASAAARSRAPPMPINAPRRPASNGDGAAREDLSSRLGATRAGAARDGSSASTAALEPLQALARLEPQLFGERAACLVVDPQRICFPTGAIQRQHELTAKALTQWVLHDKTAQLGSDVLVAAESQVGLQPLLQGGEPEHVQSRDLALGERVVREVCERLAAPERKRLPQRRLRLRRLAGGERPPALLDEALEAIDVELTRRDRQDVAVRPRLDETPRRRRLERLTQTRNVDLHVLHGIRRRPLVPDGVDQPIHGDDLVPVQEQRREDYPLLAPTEFNLAALVVVDPEGAE